jgi:hypothetical protein
MNATGHMLVARIAWDKMTPAARAADWSHEGWELAHTAVYDGVTPGMAPSPEYVARAQKTMNEEAALAGYRLASIVNSIFRQAA